MSNTAVKSDPPAILWAIIAVSALAVSVFIMAPPMVGEMVRGLGLGNNQAGYVMSAEFAGMALACFPAYYWLHRVETAKAVRVAMTLSVLGNLATALLVLSSADFFTLLGLRVLTGLPNGSLMVICLKTISQMNNIERGYALHTVGQIAGGAVGVLVLPYLFMVTGLYAAYLLFGLAMLLALPLARHFPCQRMAALKHKLIEAPTVITPGQWLLGGLGVLGILLFYIGLVGVWTYAERIGTASGLTTTTIGIVLSVTAVLGILGASTAALLAGRVSTLAMIVLGMSMMTLSVWLFHGPQSLLRFIAAASVAKLFWTFVLPFLLSTVTAVDYSGRIVTSLFMIISIGVALGPALAAALIGETNDYDRIVWVCLGLLIACSVIMTFVAYKARIMNQQRVTESIHPQPENNLA